MTHLRIDRFVKIIRKESISLKDKFNFYKKFYELKQSGKYRNTLNKIYFNDDEEFPYSLELEDIWNKLFINKSTF